MSLEHRIKKLESAMINEAELPRIVRLVVIPGDIDPIGYVCGEVTVIRGSGETTKELHKRCCETAILRDGSSVRLLFYPLEGRQCH
jgi:hypothetical protein